MGYFCPFDLNLRHLTPARINGLSSTPPPAKVPIIARFFGLSVENFPERSFSVTPSGPCENTVALVPADLMRVPPSPKCLSTLHTSVPSGMF
ncbi:hypothetical protein MnTg01_00827 [archaeon MnTg01]|nr:hypothetical protein MnTg01_00827 [archaeon MnTg01]